jgi:2-methylcitrate dehydratase PrpD
MDAIYQFVKNFVGIQYEDLPREVVEVTKKEVLDLLGVALAGFSAPGVKELLDVITDWGGKRESRMILWGVLGGR